MCRRSTLSFVCLREKQRECHCWKNVADWCSCVQPWAGYSRLSVGKMLVRYVLSICPYFLICSVGRAPFQGPANPHDCKGCTSNKNKEILLLQSLRYRMEIEASSQWYLWDRGGKVAGDTKRQHQLHWQTMFGVDYSSVNHIFKVLQRQSIYLQDRKHNLFSKDYSVLDLWINTVREDITHGDYFVSNVSGFRDLEYSIHLTKSLANIQQGGIMEKFVWGESWGGGAWIFVCIDMY